VLSKLSVFLKLILALCYLEWSPAETYIVYIYIYIYIWLATSSPSLRFTSYICFRISFLRSTTFIFLYRSPSSKDYSILGSFSDSIENPLANCMCGDFTVNHSERLGLLKIDTAGLEEF